MVKNAKKGTAQSTTKVLVDTSKPIKKYLKQGIQAEKESKIKSKASCQEISLPESQPEYHQRLIS